MGYESCLNRDPLLGQLLRRLSLSLSQTLDRGSKAIHIKKPFVNWLLLLACTHPWHLLSLAT